LEFVIGSLVDEVKVKSKVKRSYHGGTGTRRFTEQDKSLKNKDKGKKMKMIILGCLLCMSTMVSANDDKATALFETINQRLDYMTDVALYKAQNQLAIENTKREVVVINSAKASAAKAGLDPARVERFFKAQISAAKAIQYRYRAELLTQPIERLPLDLNAQIRPALIKLGNKIIEQMADYVKQQGGFKAEQRAVFLKIVNQDFLSKMDKDKLFEGLLRIQ
jgi:chorismate mutase